MYDILQQAHSGIMWIALLLLIISIIMSAIGTFNQNESPLSFKYRLYFYTKLLLYVQFLLGLGLYFVSPKVQFVAGFMKNEELRFYGMEHPLMMLIAIGLISWGLYKAKRKSKSSVQSKTVAIYYSIALVVILSMVPWSTVLA